MSAVMMPPLALLKRLRRFNGVLPHYGHPAQLAIALNGIHGWGSRHAYTCVSDDEAGFTNLAQIQFSVPIRGDESRVKIDILAYATAAGDHDIVLTSGGDATGVKMTVSNFINGISASVGRAHWFTTGPDIGDTTAQEERAMIITDGGSGFDTVTYAGDAQAAVYAIRFTHVRDRTL